MTALTGSSRCAVAIIAGFGLFYALGLGSSQLAPPLGLDTVIGRQVALKLLMIVAAVGVWAATRRPWAEMGWRASPVRKAYWKPVALACACMMLAAAVMILTGHRHPLAAGMTFPQIVVVIWLLSSVSEEIYVRGLVQSWCRAGASPGATVATSALLFAAMHVPIIWMGGGPVGGGIIVAATLGVGWACARLRERTGSLVLPIALHIAANVSAVPGGILGVIAYRLIHGQMPALD